MMKKLLLIALLLPILNFVQAQEEIVKWTFPNNLLSDTVQNGTNTLNLTSILRTEGAGPIVMKNGLTDYAAQATNWDNGMDSKDWNITFLTTGYEQVKISSKQQGGGTYGGPKDFKLQYKVGSSDTWKDVPGGTITLANDWTIGVIADLELPNECQNQAEQVSIRWIMASNIDVKGGDVTAAGISKIDDIIVTGMLITGIDYPGAKKFRTFPNPSSGIFSISTSEGTTGIEIYNNIGQMVYRKIPENEINTIDKTFPSGIYFIKATTKGKVQVIKHIIK